MRRMIHRVVPLLVLCVVVTACAVKKRGGSDLTTAPPLGDSSQGALWREPTQLDLTMKQNRDAARWRITFAQGGLLKVDLFDAASGAPAGELILVSGHTLLTRAVNLTRDDVLEYFDDAMLSQQIATALLREAFPAGPTQVAAAHKVNADDVGQSIAAETIHTSRVYYAPWTIRGTARRVDANSVEFDLNFLAQINSSTRKETRQSYAGTWRRDTVQPKLADDFSLLGWSVWRIRVGTRDAGGVSMAGFITTPEARRYQTLGELRAAVRPGP